MDRGIYKYKCSDCGHEFIGIDMELNCTAASVSVKCPKCGSLNTRNSGLLLFDLFKEKCKEFFRNLWKNKKSKQINNRDNMTENFCSH
jgi:DNA-directed RNA polymerase subunit RPC12/RpoP